MWRSSPLAIFAVQPRPGQPDPSSLLWTAGPAWARLESAESEHLRIEAWAGALTAASIAVAWSPKWHGTLNGTFYALGRTPDGLIAVELPAGLSRLALDYRNDMWDRLGLAITLATVAGILGWCVWRLGRSQYTLDLPVAGGSGRGGGSAWGNDPAARVPQADGTSLSPRILGLTGEAEEKGGVGHRDQLLDLQEPGPTVPE